MINTRFFALSIVFVLCCYAVGCGSKSTISQNGYKASADSPWIAIDEDEFGGVSAGGTETVAEFKANNIELNSLLGSMCNRYGVHISVQPDKLASRGINITVKGETALDALNDLARQGSLSVEQLDDAHFVLHEPGTNGASGETNSPAPK